MTAPPIASATGTHAGHTGAKAGARHPASAPQWSHEVAAASAAPPEPAAPTPNKPMKNPKASHAATASIGSEATSSTSSAQNAHRPEAATQPVSGGRLGHHQKGDSNSGAAAMVTLVLAAAPVLNSKTTAPDAASKTEHASHGTSPRQSVSQPGSGPVTTAESSSAHAQDSGDLTMADDPSATGASKQALPSDGQSKTLEISTMPAGQPIPAALATERPIATTPPPNRSLAPAPTAPPQEARSAGANIKESGTVATRQSSDAGLTAEEITAPQPAKNPPPAITAASAAIPMPGTQTAQPNPTSTSPASEPIPPTPSALAATIVAMQKNGDSTTTLHLNPAGLGQLTVHVSMAENSHINVQFLPATPQAAHILNNNLDDLRQAMTAAGLSPGQTFVGTGDHQNSNRGNSQPPPQGRQYSQTRAAPADSATPGETTKTGLSAYA